MPYAYRKMTPQEREEIVRERAQKGHPLHAPPHLVREKTYYLLTAANFEHKYIMAKPERRTEFQQEVMEKFQEADVEIAVWVFLKNHYHLLAFVPAFDILPGLFKQLHGSTSRQWNLEDNKVGRKVWYKYTDRRIRSERHYYATLNYLHYNPIKHRLVKRMSEWQWSSFNWYIEEMGRDWLAEVWRQYPIRNYGDKWDNF